MKRENDVQAALFDVDGTLTSGGEFWSALLKSPDIQQYRLAWLYMTAMPHYALSKAHMVSQARFRDRWVHLMAWLMTGWTKEQTQRFYHRVVSEFLVPILRPDVVAILQDHKARGHYVVLVSTMFEGIVDEFAKQVGADRGLGSQIALRDDDVCAGRIVDSTCSGARKVDFARSHLAQTLPGVALDQCAAYADSRSDIPFLQGVGYPVATYPDKTMRAYAVEQGWTIFEG